jgi:spore germination cell wall hydrolase CwlJ-like protein
MTDKPALFPLPGGNSAVARVIYTDMEIDAMARTIWGEARGEGSAGMQAVACVILNRVRTARMFGGYWWGNDVMQVCHKPYQFSCWNKDDPNYRRLLAVTDSDIHFATAKRIARRAVLGFVDDPTYGADHYHAKSVTPQWSKGKKPTTVIGRHLFYKLAGA